MKQEEKRRERREGKKGKGKGKGERVERGKGAEESSSEHLGCREAEKKKYPTPSLPAPGRWTRIHIHERKAEKESAVRWHRTHTVMGCCVAGAGKGSPWHG